MGINNKRPKGPHNVHLNTMCNILMESDWPGRPFLYINRPEKTDLEEDIKILLPVKFCSILFSGFRGEVENITANQRLGRPSCFSDRPEKHKLGRGR